MTSLKKAVLYGLFIWLVPFATAFVIFPLREVSRPLFESIMPGAVALSAVSFGLLYLRDVTEHHVREAVTVGLLWLAIAVVIDLPLMLIGGPMKMTLGAYVADIGVTYLIIPVVVIGLGVALTLRRPGGTPP